MYGHTGNLGNECAATLGALGLVSSHNLSTRWAHHTPDTAARIASCNNNGHVLEKLHDIRTEMTSMSQNGEIAFDSSPGSLWFTRMHRIAWVSFSPLLSLSPYNAWLYLTCTIESPTSCVSTASSSDERFHAQNGGIFEIFVDEIDLARLALSCHFALDVLCDKESVHDSA